MPFAYKKTSFQDAVSWLERSSAHCFYCEDKEGAPLQFVLFPDHRGICESCCTNFQIGHLVTDRHVIEKLTPRFSSREEALKWFIEQSLLSGHKIKFGSVIPDGDDPTYHYLYIHDVAAYHASGKLSQRLHVPAGRKQFIKSFSTLVLRDDGSYHIAL